MYKDISNDPAYRGLVGKEFRTLDEFLIFGYATDLHSKKIAGYTILTAGPGIAGPEILTKGVLPVGSTIRVERIVNCVNCLDLSKRVFVTITSDRSYEGVEAKIRDTEDIFTSSEGEPAVDLNPRLFSRVK